MQRAILLLFLAVHTAVQFNQNQESTISRIHDEQTTTELSTRKPLPEPEEPDEEVRPRPKPWEDEEEDERKDHKGRHRRPKPWEDDEEDERRGGRGHRRPARPDEEPDDYRPPKKVDEEESDEPFGPDDFLDEFTKEFLGYTVKEIHALPSISRGLLINPNKTIMKHYLDWNKKLPSRDKYIVDDCFDKIHKTLVKLSYRQIGRREAVTRLLKAWKEADQKVKKRLLTVSHAYQILDDRVKSRWL